MTNKQKHLIPTPQNIDSSFRGAGEAREPIITFRGHGFPLSPLRGSAGVTNSGRWYEAPTLSEPMHRGCAPVSMPAATRRERWRVLCCTCHELRHGVAEMSVKGCNVVRVSCRFFPEGFISQPGGIFRIDHQALRFVPVLRRNLRARQDRRANPDIGPFLHHLIAERMSRIFPDLKSRIFEQVGVSRSRARSRRRKARKFPARRTSAKQRRLRRSPARSPV
jgi:hypothetical protein